MVVYCSIIETKSRGKTMEHTAFLQNLISKAQQNIKTIVLPEGEDNRILQAAHIIAEKNAAKLIILGNKEEITKYFNEIEQ